MPPVIRLSGNPTISEASHTRKFWGNRLVIRYLLAMRRIESEFLEQPLSQVLPGISEGEIIVIRSTRRKRNIAAYRQGGQIVVSIPARLSKADERMVVPEMVAKVRAQEATRVITDSALSGRVVDLLARWAPEMNERPFSVTWRENMNGRWGSCTNVDGTIRISSRLARFPEYVLDFVLFHEGIHLRYGDHGAQFQEILARFPQADLAQAYLDGYEAAENALTPASLSL
ncbi:MAG TPA: M48 family metallopeptidase [Candidatus Paceibacterota bacterium]|nr:M48 family metallopeptidase [Candidatus Paceibacterota bacterium]